MNVLFLISTSTSAYLSYFILIGILFPLCFHPFFKQKFPTLKRTLTKLLIGLGLLSLILVVCFPFLTKIYFMKFFKWDFAKHHSFYERWQRLLVNWKLFKEYPFFGVGYGAIPSFLFDAWAKKDLQFAPLIAVHELDRGIRHLKMFEPSNFLLELLGSLGMFGLAAFLYLFHSFARQVKKSLKDPLNKIKKWVFLFFVSCLLMGVMVQINQGLLRTYVWVHFAIAYALALKSQSEKKNLF